MEVHHHPTIEKKNFKEYLLEFIMIFLAVTMGFIAENLREHFTETKIASHPVSVVSLAYRRLRGLHASLDSRILMIGAGETNANLSKYLVKHGFKHFSIFNRTLGNAEKLAASLLVSGADAKAYSLEALETFREGFDVFIACTGSGEPIVTTSLYTNLLNGDSSKKILIDLSRPKKHPYKDHRCN